MLTKKQKDKYIKGGGVSCPYCGSEDIGGSSMDFDSGMGSRIVFHVACDDCGKEWIDYYELTGIEEE